MRTFVRVSQAKSFVDAANQLGMTKSAVSRQVSELESLLGVSLIQRSTRVLSLTQAGQTYLKDCLSILGALDAAEERARADVSKASGILRLGAPLSIGTRQLPLLLAAFHEEFPDISVELTMLTRTLDLAKAGLDLVLYLTGELPQAAIARKVSHGYTVACAAPKYLRNHGTPDHPRELAGHQCLIVNYNEHRVDAWRFTDRRGKVVVVDVKGWMVSDQPVALMEAAKAGQGILFLPTYLVGDELRRGRLVPLFPQWRPYRQDIHAVRMSGSHMPARARLLINFMIKHWGTTPPWDRWLEING